MHMNAMAKLLISAIFLVRYHFSDHVDMALILGKRMVPMTTGKVNISSAKLEEIE